MTADRTSRLRDRLADVQAQQPAAPDDDRAATVAAAVERGNKLRQEAERANREPAAGRQQHRAAGRKRDKLTDRALRMRCRPVPITPLRKLPTVQVGPVVAVYVAMADHALTAAAAGKDRPPPSLTTRDVAELLADAPADAQPSAARRRAGVGLRAAQTAGLVVRTADPDHAQRTRWSLTADPRETFAGDAGMWGGITADAARRAWSGTGSDLRALATQLAVSATCGETTARDGSGAALPITRANIAGRAGISTRTVTRHLARLATMALLIVARPRSRNADGQHRTRLVVALPAGARAGRLPPIPREVPLRC